MELHLDARPPAEVDADWLIVSVTEDADFPPTARALDERLGGLLTRLREQGDVTGKLAELVPLRGVRDLAAKRLLVVGLGKAEAITIARLERAFLTAFRSISDKKDLNVAVALPDAKGLGATGIVPTIVTAAIVGSTGQGLYKGEPGRFGFSSLRVLTASKDSELDAALNKGRVLGEAINLARELVNRPAQEIYPQSFATIAEKAAREHGLECEVLDELQLEREKMGALLAVAQGSDRPPRVVVLTYRGGGEGQPSLALVGKGVTFDSGGLSIKPTDGMLTMKCDMAGAATVVGAMTAIARLKLSINVVGYAGLVENMVSGRSYKLGDVLTARNGVTIEVQNTDAEGRLVLADVLSYAVDRGAERIVDLATLTGACMVALGEEVTGVFSNDEQWQTDVIAAARRVGEDVWPLPMYDHYDELIKSDVADWKNTGGRWGGAITAAKLLQKFVDDKPWVHLDIAGPSFTSSNKPHREGGGTGVMVRTLVEVAASLGAPAD